MADLPVHSVYIKNILLVDDERVIHKSLGGFLSRAGFQVDSAQDARAALRKIEAAAPDLVISDIKMPGMDGLDLLGQIKRRLPSVPVVLLTGHGSADMAVEALRNGACEYLNKPVRLHDLLDIVQRIDNWRRLERKLAKGGDWVSLGRLQNPTILVVDDEPKVLNLLDGSLRSLGYQCQLASSAEQGLNAFAEHRFDIVVSDVNLPDMDGIDMVRQMRASEPMVMPVIITGRRDQETVVRALECGARGFLTKPFTAAELDTKLAQVLDERRRVLENQQLIGELMRTRSALEKKVVSQGQALTRTEDYLHHLQDAVPFGIVSTDLQGRILSFNSTAQRLYGYTEAETIGKDMETICGAAPAAKEHVHCDHIDKHGMTIPVRVHQREVLDAADAAQARLYVVEDLRPGKTTSKDLLSHRPKRRAISKQGI